MHSIAWQQNQQEQLKRLAAQRQLYSDAKRRLALQIVLVIPVAVSLSLMGIVFPETQEWVAFLGISILLLDALVLEPSQKELVEQAARIQEAFDCSVLDLEWNEAKIDRPPGAEVIVAHAERYGQRHPDHSELKNWYPVVVDQIPLAAARIVCQRTNIRWDSELRRRYASGIYAFLLLLTAFVVGIGFCVGMTVSKFVYAVVTPLLPAFLWSIREHRRQRETAHALDRLMKQAISLWDKACQKALDDEQLKEAARTIQNEIYDHRRSAPLVFDCIYSLLRKKSEGQMRNAAGDLVDHYKRCNHKDS